MQAPLHIYFMHSRLALLNALPHNGLMDPKNIAEKLWEHYQTDAKVGEKLGIAQSTVNRIRRGVYDPSYSTYKAMLKQLEAINRPDTGFVEEV